MDGECINCGEVGNWCRCDEENEVAKPIYTMPDRPADAGPVGIERCGDKLILEVDDKEIVTSEYNAVRLLGMLSVFLKVPLDERYAKEIKL